MKVNTGTCKTLSLIERLLLGLVLTTVLVILGLASHACFNGDSGSNQPVTLERRIGMADLLKGATPDYGFTGRDYWLKSAADPHDNEDREEPYLLVLPNSQFTSGEVTLHPGAVLNIDIGFYRQMEDAPLDPVHFEVDWKGPSGSTRLFSRTLKPAATGLIKEYVSQSSPLAAQAGETGHLIFRCRPGKPDQPAYAACAWVNPRIDSQGITTTLSEVEIKQSIIAFDFIEGCRLFADKLSTDKTPRIWARGPGDRICKIKGPCSVELNFAPVHSIALDRHVSRASLVFSADHDLTIPVLAVPDEKEVSLNFAIGLKDLSCAAGGAEFTIKVNGKTRFQEKVPGGEPTDCWRDRRIDLTEHGGTHVKVTFAVAFDPPEPKEVEIQETHPLHEAGKVNRLRVERALAGFGHPRLEYTRRVPRSLSSPDHPNLLFLNIECLNSSRLGCYGSDLGLTPCLDRLAEEGILFKDFHAASSWTLPSVASLLTGVYPSIHGVEGESAVFLANHFQTLPEVLQAGGLTTAAFVANEIINPLCNFDQGFEYYYLLPYHNAAKVNSIFEDWLVSQRELRFFAYLHLFEPHNPYNAPGELADRFVPEPMRGRDSATYDALVMELKDGLKSAVKRDWEDHKVYLQARHLAEIVYVDRKIEALLADLKQQGLLDKTVIVIMGDHGEEFMEHDWFGHGAQLYNETIKVPLIVWGPEAIVGPPQEVKGVADNISMLSTAAKLMGISLDPDLRKRVGPPLYPLNKQFGGKERFAFSETARAFINVETHGTKRKPLYTIMNQQYKLISDKDGDTFELYDLEKDPLEQDNLAGKGLPDERRMKKKLERFLLQFKREQESIYRNSIDARTLEIMEAHGYM